MFDKYIFSFLLLILLNSCVSTKKTVYFRNLESMTIASKMEQEIPVIQKNDLLSITVSSLSPKASELFNAPNNYPTGTTTMISGAITQSFGYLVDEAGYIQFPIIGNIKAVGLTQKELKDTISKRITDEKLLLDPIITVRFLNFKVSILGEVARPSVYNIPSERISLLEALSLAGDLTVYSKRDNILIIREEKGEKKLVRMDLSSSEIFYSPYYYLKSNDIVYVEHNRAKVASTRPIGTWVSAVLGGASLLIVLLDRVVFN